MEAQLISGTVPLNWTYLISSGVITAVLNFGGVSATVYIVSQHAVPLNFWNQNKIKISIIFARATTAI